MPAGTIGLALLAIATAQAQEPGLAARLATAQPFDTIRVTAGVYHGNFVISQPVVLLGDSGAVLDANGKGDVLRITGSGAVVAGFTIQHSGTDLGQDDAGIRIIASDVRVERVTVRQCLHGIYVQDAAFVTLSQNTIVGHPELKEADRGNGIHLHASKHIRLERNVIKQARDGLYFSYSDSTEAIGNSVSGSRYGIHFMFSRANRFIANHFFANAGGAALMNSWDLVAVGNTFSDHRSFRAYGMAVQTTERARLVGNRFERNRVGLFLDNATGGKILDNLIANNGIGLDLFSSTEGNVIAGNVLIGNGVTSRSSGGSGTNRWERDGRGNFWDGALALDLDRDGIRDLPHREGSAFAQLAGARPALQLWRASPAMATLDLAEHALPVFNVPVIVDSFPLARIPQRRFDGALSNGPHRPASAPVAAIGVLVALLGGTLLMGLPRSDA